METNYKKRLAEVAVRTMNSITAKVAESGVVTCSSFVYQPKAPENMEARLQAMKKSAEK